MEVEYRKKFLKELSKLDLVVGIKKEIDCTIIETVKHRKETYKYFP